MIQLYRDIEAKLKADVDEIKFITMYNDQFAQMEDGSVYAFLLPAVFIEFVDELPFSQLGGGVQIMDPLYVLIHIAHNKYNANGEISEFTERKGEQELNLGIYELRNKVFKALQKFEPQFAVAFIRVGETQDKEHTNLYHYIQRYQTNYVDNESAEPVNGITHDPPTDLDLTIQYDPPPIMKEL